LIVQASHRGHNISFWYHWGVKTDQMARAAGRVAGRFAKKQAKQWSPAAKQSEAFIKHVVPATVKPFHALWHEILAFCFLALAGMVAWQAWRKAASLSVLELVLGLAFAAVSAGYGISSYLKARRISRS
jgi:hypothetical protein